ncbi:glycosyltransferase family 4 protein [Tateyamaria sp.]|uniref:glycosyltransferase family 4 protein n=1 Tax=Tateyamaria sp. TaxID=1929288 RepID=UPI00329FDD14
MNIAFFAPLKPPTHPVPSGDRAMARALMAALEAGGQTVTLTSELRLFDGRGDTAQQDRFFELARQETARILASPTAKDWRVWLTYHNYYKAPDLIGPVVARALGIPYILIESSRARKRLIGPWARFAEQAEAASDAAHTIFYMTMRDSQALIRDAPKAQALRHLPPFLARPDLPPASSLTGPMLSVGMMRPGDKLASYTLIAQALAALPTTTDWRMDIAGDGPARAEVAEMMAPFGDRVRLHGLLDTDALSDLYTQGSLLVWPGVNEAFGINYLEAQAAGIPVVAQDRPGVRDVVFAPMCRVDAGPAALADAMQNFITDPDARRSIGTRGRIRIGTHHLLGAATETLLDTIEGLT